MDRSGSDAGAAAFLGAFFLVYILIICAAVAFAIWVHWRILSKAGFNGALGRCDRRFACDEHGDPGRSLTLVPSVRAGQCAGGGRTQRHYCFVAVLFAGCLDGPEVCPGSP